VFERQVEATVRPGDVVAGISTSGNSKNVLRAIAKAKELGATTIGFSGSAGKLKEMVDIALTVPSTRTPRIQEGYMAAAHVICGLVERSLFGKRAVFIDRDGTVAKDVPYCPRPEDLILFHGVGAAIKKLNEAGFLVIVITNQSGIDRGYFTEDTLCKIHEKMIADLAKEGAKVDAIYHCPHLPDAGCRCRKPELGMILQALEEFPLDLVSSYVMGDSDHDLELAKRIGAKGVQVSEAFTFPEAVEFILKEAQTDD
jgi:D-sedoheptulose 7-phosphate isomerase